MKLVVGACIVAAVILIIICCCFILEHSGYGPRQWASEEEEIIEIPNIGGHTGDHNLPSRDAQYPGKQWDGRAWASSRDPESSYKSSQQQYNMTRNVIVAELGHSRRQGGEYRGKSTGDQYLPPIDAHYSGKEWDGRSWVESRDPQSSQQQYTNTRNVREERLKAPVPSAICLQLMEPSAPAVLELEKPTSSQGGYRGGFTRKPTGDNNDSDLKEKKTKNQGELSQQERREVKLNPALLELKKQSSLQGGQTCCVCMTQTIEIIFNCAHAATCEECAKSLSVCPICRADITSRNRIYISGI